jgi:hypothetical protein
MRAEIKRLRARVAEFAKTLEGEYERQAISKAFLAESCDRSNAEGGSLTTLKRLQRAADLTGGRWGEESIGYFIDADHY